MAEPVTLTIREGNLQDLHHLPDNLHTLIINDVGMQMFIFMRPPTKVVVDFPLLPESLKVFDFGFNNFAKMPTLPHSLEVFKCNQNDLSELPQLPDTLEYLDCGNNKLTALPELPRGLLELNCSTNRLLIALPELPSSLLKLDCSNRYGTTMLTALPKLPSGLLELNCSGNKLLTALPELPRSLLKLDCDGNDLTFLPTNLPPNLRLLGCKNNNLTWLPNLPESLQTLRVDIDKLEIQSLRQILTRGLMQDEAQRIAARIQLLQPQEEGYMSVAREVRKTVASPGPSGVRKSILENDLMKQALTDLGVDIKGLGRKKKRTKKKTKRTKRKTRRKY